MQMQIEQLKPLRHWQFEQDFVANQDCHLVPVKKELGNGRPGKRKAESQKTSSTG